MPSDREASIWPFEIDWMPARKISVMYAPYANVKATTAAGKPSIRTSLIPSTSWNRTGRPK